MASVRYYNQAGPFWDFIADLEAQGSDHPLIAQFRGAQDDDRQPRAPFSWGWPFENTRPPPPPFSFGNNTSMPKSSMNAQDQEAEHDMPSRSRSDSPAAEQHEQSHEDRAHGRNHHRGRHGRGGCFSRGRGGPGPRGGHRGWARHGAFGPGGPMNMNGLAALFNAHFLNGWRDETEEIDNSGANEDFKPLVDVFDTDSSYILHLSLPGAKKEDVSVRWDAEKSEMCVTGVVHRPGDEEFLKTLALNERQIGAFERKIRLGSRVNPAQIDSNAITARLDAGILIIEVPKEDKDYVDIKKVDIE